MTSLYLSEQNLLHVQVRIVASIVAILGILWVVLAILFLYQFRKPLIGDLCRLGSINSNQWNKDMGAEEFIELDHIGAYEERQT
jgi:hypothetical protein